MPYSEPHFHRQLKEWVNNNFILEATLLDVGPGAGAIAELLWPRSMDCVEVWGPYFEQFQYNVKYTQAFCCNAKEFRYEMYDLAVACDVLEHFTVLDAQRLLRQITGDGCSVVLQVPFRYGQGPIGDNNYEEHKQNDLTHPLMMERYGSVLRPYMYDDRFGLYYNLQRRGRK